MLSTAIILATEEGGSNVELVLPVMSELIAGVVAFAVVFFFVWKWALPAIDKTLEDRRKAIAGQLEEAEGAKVEAEKLLSDYRTQMAGARTKENEIIEEARITAETIRTDLVAKATAEADQIVAKARVDAAGEKKRLVSDARSEVANLSIDLAEKVVGQSLDRATQMGLVNQYIEELEN